MAPATTARHSARAVCGCMQKVQDFTADFENLFAWYVDKAGVEVAWRFQAALDISLVKFSIRPDLGRPRHFRPPKLRGLRSFHFEPCRVGFGHGQEYLPFLWTTYRASG